MKLLLFRKEYNELLVIRSLTLNVTVPLQLLFTTIFYLTTRSLVTIKSNLLRNLETE
jgi:hypothetical protein